MGEKLLKIRGKWEKLKRGKCNNYQDGGENRRGSWMSKEAVSNDLKGVIGVDSFHNIVNHGGEDFAKDLWTEGLEDTSEVF